MRLSFQQVFWWLRDRTFPLAQPLSQQEQDAISERRAEQAKEWDARTRALPHQQELLAKYLANCKTALDDERDRAQSVNARLTTIIGLSSIAGTIVFGTILTNMQRSAGPVHWLILFFLLYLPLQLASAILAGVCGLERRSYEATHPTDLLPATDEPPEHHARRQLQAALGMLVQHQDQNNAKVTQMAVAHRAMKNFVWGLLVLAILACAYRITMAPSDDLVERLKQDHELRDLLRGPQGNPGPLGPAGTPCALPTPAPKRAKGGAGQ